MPFIVYETTNLVNGKKYRGVHKQDDEEFDGYLGSGRAILRAIKKHGRTNFSRTAMFVSETKEDAYEFKAAVVDEEWRCRKDTYNVSQSAKRKRPWTPEHRAAHSASMKAAYARPECLAAKSASSKAAWARPEYRAAQSTRLRLMGSDPEYRAAMSTLAKLKCADPKYRAAMSARSKASWARLRLTKANAMLVVID
jgi:hypothetical protein